MKIHYRPEIDGLRAISVLSVILYHLEVFISSEKVLTGGFIGVDIFFVISGYLITSIIYKEIILSNNISIFNFYERRIRRIIPILLTVSISFLLASYIYSLPTPLWKSAESILASTFFLGNFYFLNARVQYGDQISNLEPFLHTWSLSIEEQFYIVFPVFFFYAYKYFNKYLVHILIIIFLSSLLINNYSSRSWMPIMNNLSFYMLPFRGWEILSGCILAVVQNKIKIKKSFLNIIVPKISFIIILYAIIFFDFEKTKPLPHLFFVVLSTIGIIWFSNKNELITKILSWSPLVKIGLISFSLYLWHFPVFSLYRQIDFNSKLFIDPAHKVFLIIFIFLLSFASYKFIEKPFRNKKKISGNVLLRVLFLSIFFISIFSISAVYTKGFKNRFDKFYSIFNNYEIDNKYLYLEWGKPLDLYYSKNSKPFTNSKKKKILIVGNSHAIGLFNSFNLNKDIFSNYEFSVLRIDLPDLKKKKFIEFEKSEYIFLSKRYSDSKNFKKFFNDWQVFLKKEKKKFIVVLNRPEFLSNSANNYTLLDEKIYPKIRENSNNLIKFKKEISKNYYNLQQARVKKTNDTIKKVLIEKNIKYFDPFDYSCNEVLKYCDVLTDGNSKIYYDYGHYTLEGSKFFGKKIKILNWLKM